MTPRTGRGLRLKWIGLLTLFAVSLLIVTGMTIVQVYREELRRSFVVVQGVALIAGILLGFLLARKLAPPTSLNICDSAPCKETPVEDKEEYFGRKGFVKDVSDRKRVEEELRKSEEKYRTIVESIQDGYFEVDLAGNFTFVNDAECRQLGYSREELIGMNYRQSTDEGTAKKVRQVYNKVYRTGIPIERMEEELVRRDGTKGTYEVSVSLIRDLEGRPAGFRGISRDVTERKRREEEIQRKTVLLEAINNIFKVALTCETSAEVARKCLTLAQELTSSQFGFIGEINEAGNFDTIAMSDPGWKKCKMPKADAVVMINDMEIRGIWGQVIKDRKSLIVNQPSSHPDRVGLPEGHPPITAFLGVPLEHSGRTFGMISLANKESGYASVDQEMIENLSGAFVEVLMRKRAETALRQSEEKYRTILESIEDGYYETDLTGNLTFFNDSMWQIYGYPREELMGMNNRQYTDRENAKKVFQAFNKVYKTGKPGKVFDYEIIRKDGTKRYIETSVSLRKDSSGKPVGFRGIVRDSTERNQMEEALRQSEEKYRTILESMQEAYYELDLAGNFTFINDTVCRHLGYSREELIGMNNRGYQDAVGTERSYQLYKEVYETGKPIKIVDSELIRKDGTKGIYEMSVSLIRDSEGKPIGFRGVSREVTERRQMEEALREREERYRTLLENMEEGYYEVDLKGRFTFVNNALCKIHGLPKEEMLGMSNRQYMDEETAKKVYGIFNQVYKTGQPGKIFEWEILRKNDKRAALESSVYLIKNSKGEPVGFKGIVRDMTERKRAEEALKKSEEEARRLAQENAVVAEIGRIVGSTLNIEKVYERFAEQVRKVIPFDRISVSIVDLDCASITVAYNSGVQIAGRQPGARVALHGPYYRDIVEKRSSALVQTEDESEIADRYPYLLNHFQTGIRSFVGTPLILQDQLIGILHIQSCKSNAYAESDVKLAEKVGRQIAGAIAIAQLFSERNKAEEALRKSEEKYRTILENIEDGYYEVDLEGNFTFFNDSMCRISGYPKEELMGMNDRQYTDQETTRKLFQAFNEVYRTGKPGRVFDYEIIRKDRTKRYVETSISLRKNASNNVTGFRGILRDVTERKRAEEALRQSEEKYRTIIESVQEGYFEDDLSGNLTFFNDVLCRHLGYTREELMGMNYQQRVDETDARRLSQAYRDLYRTGEPIKALEATFVRKDGTKLIAEFSASLIKNSEGKPIGFRSISRDITERKRIEEQLFQAEKLRAVGEMASGVAHDFNNALAAILGNTQLLLHNAPDGELKETLKIIEKVAKDSGQTVRRLQDFTRRGLPQEFLNVDINTIIRDSIEMTKPRWKDESQSRGIHIEIASSLQDIPFVSGNASELREVLTNMIFNAVEAMPEGGKIEIRTFQKRRGIYIQISDTGVGIAEEAKKRIFEPFFTTKPFTNTGLGLSMSYGIIKKFGGEIEVESRVGRGTTFTITLPVGEEEKEETVGPQFVKKGRKARILVIDDEAFVRDVLSRTLAHADHQVTLAEDGRKGVQLFKEGDFDIVLTDLGMPGVSGWEVCRMIKEISPHTPVGMITGWGDEKNRGKLEEYGLDFFISKPFDFAQILNVVAEVMESKKD